MEWSTQLTIKWASLLAIQRIIGNVKSEVKTSSGLPHFTSAESQNFNTEIPEILHSYAWPIIRRSKGDRGHRSTPEGRVYSWIFSNRTVRPRRGRNLRLDRGTGTEFSHSHVLVTLPNGSVGTMAVHVINGTPDEIKARLLESVDAFLRFMLKTDRHNSEKSRYAAQLFVNYLLVSHAGLTPRDGEGRCRKRVRIRGRRRGLLIPRGDQVRIEASDMGSATTIRQTCAGIGQAPR